MWSSTLNYFKALVSSPEPVSALPVTGPGGPWLRHNHDAIDDHYHDTTNGDMPVVIENRDASDHDYGSASDSDHDAQAQIDSVGIFQNHASDSEPEIPVFEVSENKSFLSKGDALEYIKIFSLSNGFCCSIKNSNQRYMQLQCSCSGSYRPHRLAVNNIGHDQQLERTSSTTNRLSSSLKTNCPFKVAINYSTKDCEFHIYVKNGSHNHQPIPLDITGKGRLESLNKYHGPMIFCEFENGLTDKDILLRVRKESQSTIISLSHNSC
jgi:hypothetical protein